MAINKKNKLSSTSAPVIISIALILFLLTIFGWFLLTSRAFSNHVKQSIEIDVFFENTASENNIKLVEKELQSLNYIKSARYLSKEEAWENFKKSEGGDFADDMLDGIPIKNSIIVNLKPSHANIDSVKSLENSLSSKYEHLISEVSYNKGQFKTINEGIYTVLLYLLLFCLVLLIIAVILINNTIRLAVFSKRFLIRTMQLVGAKNNFIKRPFLVGSIYQGIIASLIAIILFMGAGYLLLSYYPELKTQSELFQDKNIYIILIVGVFITGILISFVSTYFSLQRYLSINIDKLYKF